MGCCNTKPSLEQTNSLERPLKQGKSQKSRLSSEMSLKFTCDGIQQPLASKSGTVVALYRKSSNYCSEFLETTEVIHADQSPSWRVIITVDFNFEKQDIF